MSPFKYPLCFFLLITITMSVGEQSFGHGQPLNLIVEPLTNRLAVSGHVDHGIFDNLAGTIFTNEPGIGVSDPGNGLASGTEIGLVVTQGLLYWDGTALAPTTATVSILPHIGAGYDVTTSSGLQTGMHLGTYNGLPLWDEHLDFILTPSSAPAGLYGMAVQFVAEPYGPSDPVVMSFTLGTWDDLAIAAAIELMESELLPTANPDFNNDGQTDAADLAMWSTGFGTATLAGHGQGESDGDGDVDGFDFLAWQRGVASAIPSSQTIPEPSAIQVALLCALASSCCRFCGCGPWGRLRHPSRHERREQRKYDGRPSRRVT